MASRKVTLVVALIAVGLLADFELMYRHPSQGLIDFINKVSGAVVSTPTTAPTSVAAAIPKVPRGASEPKAVAVEQPEEIARAHAELQRGHRGGAASQNILAGAAAGGVGAGARQLGAAHGMAQRHFDGPPPRAGGASTGRTLAQQPDAVVAVAADSGVNKPSAAASPPPAATPTATKYNFRSQRFNAKHHMSVPVLLFFEYPMSYWLCTQTGFTELPFISANLISCIHPLFGLLAGYLIVKAAVDNKTHSGVTIASTGASTRLDGSPTTTMASASVVSLTATGEASPKTLQIQASQDDVGFEGRPLMDRRGIAAATPHNNAAPRLAPETTVDVAARGAADEAKEPSTLFTSANMRYLRIAALCLVMRNFLDSLDGVVARVQRAHAAAQGRPQVPTSTTVGLNGHTVDMVTDTLGVCAVGFSIFGFLLSKNLAVHRIPAAILVRLNIRWHLSKSQAFSKTIACIGLLNIAAATSCWETFMLRYSNLFDQHANTNPAIFALDNDWYVRTTEFLWSFSCGDAIVNFIAVAIFFNKMWEMCQVFFFFGITWNVALTMYSAWVWRYIVMADATAAQIIAENPDQFM